MIVSHDHAARDPETKPEPKDRRKQADRLIDYARARASSLFCDQMGMPHALLSGEAIPLNTQAYKWLRREMLAREGIAPTGEALKTAVGMLAALAEDSGDVSELHTRSAFHEGAVYYYLRPGRVVRIARDGWTVLRKGHDDIPVMFREVRNLKPLPDPEPGGTLEDLQGFVNLKSGRDKRMFAAYVATLPFPHIPRPILQTTGVMGSGKTTAGRVLKRLLDPTAPETVRMDPRDFLQKASHCYIVMLDNVNSIPEWGVDTLCRLVTGEADSKRSLYTDDEDFIYEMKRAVLLNGINTPTDRGDAQDRTLPIELERISDGKRRTEDDLWAGFYREHGRLLGAVFDALSGALAERDALRLSRRPRLADWGEYAAAVYRAMRFSEDGQQAEQLFLKDWGEVVRVQNQGTLDGSPVAQAILSFMESRHEWTGLASDLHAKLEVEAEEMSIDVKREKMWPKSALWLGRRIREVQPLLTAMGVGVAIGSNGKTGTEITLTRVPAGGGPGGGSKEGATTTITTTENPAEESASEDGGSRGSNSGYPYTSLSQPREEKAANQGKNSTKADTGRELPTNTTSTTSTAGGAVSGGRRHSQERPESEQGVRSAHPAREGKDGGESGETPPGNAAPSLAGAERPMHGTSVHPENDALSDGAMLKTGDRIESVGEVFDLAHELFGDHDERRRGVG
jgi:hypothetical protein